MKSLNIDTSKKKDIAENRSKYRLTSQTEEEYR